MRMAKQNQPDFQSINDQLLILTGKVGGLGTLLKWSMGVGAAAIAGGCIAYNSLISEMYSLHTSQEALNRALGVVEGKMDGGADQKSNDASVIDILRDIQKRLPPPAPPQPTQPAEKTGAADGLPNVINGWIGTKVDDLKSIAGVASSTPTSGTSQPVWIYTLDPATAQKFQAVNKLQ